MALMQERRNRPWSATSGATQARVAKVLIYGALLLGVLSLFPIDGPDDLHEGRSNVTQGQ